MSQRSVRLTTLIAVALVSICMAARADCEADMAQLDQVLKNPKLSAEGRKGLLEAKKKAVAAVKIDDDATCNKVIVAAIKEAGVAPAPTTPTSPAIVGKAAPALGDMAAFRTPAAATLRLVKLGDLPNAKMSAKDLEAAWDQAAPRLRPRNADAWKNVDQAIDRVLAELRASKPDATSSAKALSDLLAVFDATK
jgi:hypothetical protein